MNTENSFQFQSVISARFTPDDLDFLNSNAELLFGEVSKQLNARSAILHLAEKALSRKQIVEKPVTDPAAQEQINQLLDELKEWRAIKQQFADYLTIAKRDNLAENYFQLFGAFLKTLHHPKINMWKIDESDQEFLKMVKNGN